MVYYYYYLLPTYVSFSLEYRFTSASVFLLFTTEYKMCTCSYIIGKKEVTFSMAIGNEELMEECFPKHWRMGTVRMK